MATTGRPADTSPGLASFPQIRRIPVAIVATGSLLAGGVAAMIYSLVATAAGVVFVAGPFGSEPFEIPAYSFLTSVLIYGWPGIALAAAMGRWTKKPRQAWIRSTMVLTVLSFGIVVVADASTAAKLALAAAHIVAAAVVIPAVAARLDPVNTRRL